MATRGRRRRGAKGLLAKLRKPIAPPARVEENRTKYRRARERQALRRRSELGES